MQLFFPKPGILFFPRPAVSSPLISIVGSDQQVLINPFE
jgi:hypothetical protein